jgi:hypothetical protein
MVTCVQVGTPSPFNLDGTSSSSSRNSGVSTFSPLLEDGGTLGPHGQYGHANCPSTSFWAKRSPDGGRATPALSDGGDAEILGQELSYNPFTLQGEAKLNPH